jgi:peptide-methionine (S)-S-oxide reductase
MEIATFGAGCFWGVEDSFRKIEGVISTSVGYAGGKIKNPSYEDVCSGATGHAEVVRIVYNPKIISFEDLLNVFWSIHNPTTLNRQGNDIGNQYRSIIFYHNNDQKLKALESKEKLEKSGTYKGFIVTEIVKFTNFYLAEEYHQKYFLKNG